MTWSNLFGSVSSSLWFILTMNGIRCAYRRDTEARTPNVDATALHPPSMASSTMLVGSKYLGLAVAEQRLQVAQHLWRAIGLHEDPLDEVGTRQVQVVLRDALRLVGEQIFGS